MNPVLWDWGMYCLALGLAFTVGLVTGVVTVECRNQWRQRQRDNRCQTCGGKTSPLTVGRWCTPCGRQTLTSRDTKKLHS